MATPPSTPPLSDLRYALAWLAAIGATALAAATLLYFQNRTVNDEHAALYRGRVKRTTLASLPTEIENTLALLRQGRTPTPEGMGDYLQTRK